MAAILKLSPPDAGIAFSLSGKARLAQRPARINSKTPAPKIIRCFFGNFTLLNAIETISVHSSIPNPSPVGQGQGAVAAGEGFRNARAADDASNFSRMPSRFQTASTAFGT